MRRLSSLIALLAALAVAPVAFGADAAQTSVHVWKDSSSTNAYNMLEGVALTAAESARTLTLTTNNRWSKLRVFVFYTASNATAVTTTFYCSLDSTNYAQMSARDIDGGTAAVSPLVDSNAVDGENDENYMLEYDTRGCAKVKLIFAGTGADASDEIDVQVSSIAGA